MKASKLELWWWLMFNHKKFDRWVSINESDAKTKVIELMQKQFEDKLEFLAMKDERESMLASGLEYPVLQIPIHNPSLKPYQPDFSPTSSFKVDIYNKKELMWQISFCNERITIDDFKKQATSKLAKGLVDAGLLKSRFWRNGPETVVEFYVNIYQK